MLVDIHNFPIFTFYVKIASRNTLVNLGYVMCYGKPKHMCVWHVNIVL